MNKARFFNISVALALLCSTPTHPVTIESLKKSFVDNMHSFLACLKGDKNCSPQSVKAVRAGTALVGALIILAGGRTFYLWQKKAHTSPLPYVTDEEIKLYNTLLDHIKNNEFEKANKMIQDGLVNIDKPRSYRGGVPGHIPTLSILVRENNKDAIKLALDLGANINAQSFENDYTPLMESIESSIPDMVTYLLDQKADIEAKDILGQTPLIIAASASNPEIVQLLLKRGANRDVRNKDKETALQIVKRHLNDLKKDPSIIPGWKKEQKKANEDLIARYEQIINLLSESHQ